MEMASLGSNPLEFLVCPVHLPSVILQGILQSTFMTASLSHLLCGSNLRISRALNASSAFPVEIMHYSLRNPTQFPNLHSIVTLDWLPSHFVCVRLLTTSCHCSFSPSSKKTPRLQLFIIVECCFHVFALFFIHDVQVFVAALATPRCNVSCLTTRPTCPVFSLATFLLAICFPFLPLPFCQEFFLSLMCTFFHLLDILFFIPALTISKTPLSVALFLRKRLATQDQRFSGSLLLSIFRHHLSPTFKFPSDRLVSTFLLPTIRNVAILSMKMFCNASRSSSYDIVVPRNLKSCRLSSISFLTASIYSSSSMTVPNLFSNLFISLMNVLKTSSNGSTSLALSRSEMLLISAAHAFFLRHVPLIVSPYSCVPRFESLLSSCFGQGRVTRVEIVRRGVDAERQEEYYECDVDSASRSSAQRCHNKRHGRVRRVKIMRVRLSGREVTVA